MKPIGQRLPAPQATVEHGPNGVVVRASCRECAADLRLPCRDETGAAFVPNVFALKWADMLVCTRCAELEEVRRSSEDEQRAVLQRAKSAGIPDSFRGLRFEDMDGAGVRGDAIAAAWAWADAPPGVSGGVLLHGVAGTGKTRLAGTAVWRRLQRFPVVWCSVAHLIAQLQASFSDADRKDAVRRLTGSGALVLDDLDKVRVSEWVLSQLFVAIDRRVQAGSLLFVTTNERPSALAERFGGPLTSRLLGYCRVFELAGRDRRLSSISTIGEK